MVTFGGALRENKDFQELKSKKLGRIGLFGLINAGGSVSDLFHTEEAFAAAWLSDSRHVYSDPANDSKGEAYAEAFAEYWACWLYSALIADSVCVKARELRKAYGGFEATSGGAANADGILMLGRPAGTNPAIPDCVLTLDIGTYGEFQS